MTERKKYDPYYKHDIFLKWHRTDVAIWRDYPSNLTISELKRIAAKIEEAEAAGHEPSCYVDRSQITGEGRLYIGYRRPETPQETEERLRSAEFEEYERLKKKFEGQGAD